MLGGGGGGAWWRGSWLPKDTTFTCLVRCHHQFSALYYQVIQLHKLRLRNCKRLIGKRSFLIFFYWEICLFKIPFLEYFCRSPTYDRCGPVSPQASWLWADLQCLQHKQGPTFGQGCQQHCLFVWIVRRTAIVLCSMIRFRHASRGVGRVGRDPVADVEGFFFLNNRAICHTLYIFAVFAGDIKTDFYSAFFFLARGMFCGWCNEENSALTSARPAILGQRVSLVGCSVVGRLGLGLMPSLS